MEGIGGKVCKTSDRSKRSRSGSRLSLVISLLALVFLTLAFHPNTTESLSDENYQTEVKYNGQVDSRGSGLTHINRLLTILKSLKLNQNQNVPKQQRKLYDNIDDQHILSPSYESEEEDDDNNDADDSGTKKRMRLAGPSHGIGGHGALLSPQSKRGPGTCINSCMTGGMSFIRCKSMCN